MTRLSLAGVSLALPTRRVGPLDLSFGPGVVHLRGENGSGKTTLLRVICGELRPTAGAVTLDGASPLTDTSARRRISFVPAIPELSGFLTVAEAWRLLAALRGAPTWDGDALAESLGLDPARRLDQLSVGQRRKAELIAGLAGDPGVLLLDEPFAPLDAGSAARLAAHLDGLRESRILLLTGHGALPVRVDQALDL